MHEIWWTTMRAAIKLQAIKCCVDTIITKRQRERDKIVIKILLKKLSRDFSSVLPYRVILLRQKILNLTPTRWDFLLDLVDLYGCESTIFPLCLWTPLDTRLYASAKLHVRKCESVIFSLCLWTRPNRLPNCRILRGVVGPDIRNDYP